MASFDQRLSGVLLHLTSLSGPHGSGDLGEEAKALVDWLADAAQSYWQMLPVVPAAGGGSPYSSPSAFAGNPLLINLSRLVTEGLLVASEIENAGFPEGSVQFAKMSAYRMERLHLAFERFRAEGTDHAPFFAYCQREAFWLHDYALFTAISAAHGNVSWTDWPVELRDRHPQALAEAEQSLATEIRFHQFLQFQFETQWQLLRAHARARGIALLGDLPIFVGHDSADVWAHRHLFFLDTSGHPLVVAGVPPDYFSATGQRWGNVLYDWERHAEDNYSWWTARFASTLARFDAVRVDHFIGFHRYWAIPNDAPSAITGKYMPGPGAALFDAIEGRLGKMPIVAEDLGVVTEAVTQLRERFGFPGMRVLQFSFSLDRGARDTQPFTIVPKTVVYTGTHDNDTTRGWWDALSALAVGNKGIEGERDYILRYLGTEGSEIHWDLLRLAWSSSAHTAIAPAQDLLGLPTEARMNVPGKVDDNWSWRLLPDQLTKVIQRRLREMTMTFGRDP